MLGGNMEYRKLREESEQCVKFERIEAIVKHYNREFGFVVFAGNMLYEIDKVTTTNRAAIFHLGEAVGVVENQGVAFKRPYSRFVEARHLVEIVVKNGKSVYIAHETDVYEAVTIHFDVDTILLGVGGLVGKFVYDRTDIKQSKENNGDAWFNYN